MTVESSYTISEQIDLGLLDDHLFDIIKACSRRQSVLRDTAGVERISDGQISADAMVQAVNAAKSNRMPT